ncbi:MAG: DUF883 family protein [Proteobacteria bacterium]|nr:DUF883 family protein [Pseudomonadota bacterium]
MNTSDDPPRRRRIRADDDGSAQLASLVDEGRALMHNVAADSSAYRLDDSVAALRERFVALQDALAEVADVVGMRSERAVRAADGYVRDNPWGAVAQAAALGFALGWIVGGRR